MKSHSENKILTCCFIFLTVLIGISLNGCASQSSKQAALKEKEIQLECQKSDILLSDLKKPKDKREYLLKPGVVCHD